MNIENVSLKQYIKYLQLSNTMIGGWINDLFCCLFFFFEFLDEIYRRWMARAITNVLLVHSCDDHLNQFHLIIFINHFS